MKYNLELLKSKETRNLITRFVNGKASEKEVIKTLDAICGQKVQEDGVQEDGVQEATDYYPSTKEEYETALSGNKPGLIAFASKYAIDISTANNNAERAQLITDFIKA